MAAPISDSTRRFSNRARYYAECRPRYSLEVIPYLAERAGFSEHSVVVDVGSGTGISSELFLPHSRLVYGVEPNPEMREVAERLLSRQANFLSIDGTAETTGLPDNVADFIVVGSAFHWFDKDRCRVEFRRILKGNGALVALTNRWRKEASPLMHGLRELFREFANRQIRSRVEDVMNDFMAPEPVESAGFNNVEQLDFSKLSGRLLSYSVIPLPGETRYEEMMHELKQLFGKHEQDGEVDFLSETKVYWGKPT